MKKMYKLLFLTLIATSANAVSINFSAVNTNGVGNSSGSDLAVGNLVEVGTWDGSSFSVLGSTQVGSFSGLPGEFTGVTDSLDTNGLGIAGNQLALKWYESIDDSGLFGIAYLDGSQNPEWFLKAGDGSGSDTAENAIDLADLTSGGTVLVADVDIPVGSFGGSSSTFSGNPLFLTAVPEPSAYAALAGLCALAWVAVRRRK